MSPSTFWLTAVAAGVGTFALRGSFLLFSAHREAPPWLARALRYVPPAVLAALVLPAVVRDQGAFVPLRIETLAAAVAALVAWRTKDILATLGAGMTVFWIGRALIG